MEYWHNRWDKQLTGWHREVFNDLLEKHWSNINPPKDGEVLVPLCGKSLDMIWLAKQGHKVVGLELVQQAIEIFFQENKLEYSSIKADKHTKYSSPPFTIYQGNIFDLQSGMIQSDAWYDRAAMVALPNSFREQYVKQIYNQTKPGAVGFLITFSKNMHYPKMIFN